ncbi:hypothetical protein [Hydrogenovibrio marinus]|uniref:Uncharacterized protein n=1 Tax=Hydrogenovibrio marinus TaxID=28885 RepID=A0A066ZMK0_HYDMR|nr:hypothetical protein [Hydrogenovibrio marinus]KDN94697.1 hypothetical protein EI16_12425 [Hydrogenovibrio marinus]
MCEAFPDLNKLENEPATCIGCGCNDFQACLDPKTGQGCSWLRVDHESGLGVCSVCEDHVDRWDEGERVPNHSVSDKYSLSEHIEFFGDQESGYSGSTRSTGIPSNAVPLEACPFCHSTNQRIVNTHTPSYWIECQCGIELHASHIESDGQSYLDYHEEHDPKKLDSVKGAHFRALNFIIDKWNGLLKK